MNVGDGTAGTHAPLPCLIVDDEPLARRVLEQYVHEHPALSCAGSIGEPARALMVLRQAGIELLFLDVRMPRLSGFDLLRALPRPPAVIFTTAYRDYAVDGFDIGAADYLLKPISRERFQRAVSRVMHPALQRGLSLAPSRASERCVFVRADQRIVRLDLDDVPFVEACENYVRIHTRRKAYLMKRTMTEMDALLTPYGFVRIHRSFMVNISAVERIQDTSVFADGRVLPLSRRGRECLLSQVPML